MVITNEQLVARIQAGEETVANMLQLWQQTKAFVAKLAKKYKGYAEFDDLMQEGYLGLNEAVNHYDVSQHIPFINYAAYWIKQRMQRFTERNSTVRLPSDMYHSVMKYRRIVGEYQPFPPFVRFSSHGVPPHAGQDQPQPQSWKLLFMPSLLSR